MSTAIAKVKKAMIAAGAAAAMIMVVSTANAATCRSTVDEDGESVVLCGDAMALYDEDDDEDDSRGFVYDENEGSLMVDLENCEPGKFWMMETDEADDIPLPCR